MWPVGAITVLAELALVFQPSPAMLRAVFEEGLARKQDRFGVFDARTAQAARDLGLFLMRQGETSDARNILDQVVRIDEKVFGHDAPQTLADVAELAAVSSSSEAGPRWTRASASSSAATAARAFAELGELSALQGDRARAAVFYRKAVAKDGPGDSEAAALHLNALAKLAPAEAIPLLERALEIDRRILGPRHAETATTEANLAGLLADTPRNGEAIRLATEALAVFRRTIGPEHPRTAVAASILGYAFEVKGDRTRAEQMYRLALRIDERVYGPKHTQTVNDARVLNEFLKSAPK